MNKPFVICHMASSIDGRIIPENWGDRLDRFGSVYEDCHDTFDSQAWMVGRITMEKDFTEGKKPNLTKPPAPIDRKSFIGDTAAKSFAVAVDAKGKLGWDSNEIDGDHIIEILSEAVSDEYLHYLRTKKISYIFAGKANLDLALALSELHDVFNIQTLMLEGGGHINGSLLHAGLIDEISLLVLPIVDGTINSATTFEVGDYLPKKDTQDLKLLDIQKLDHGVVWLRYRVIAI